MSFRIGSARSAGAVCAFFVLLAGTAVAQDRPAKEPPAQAGLTVDVESEAQLRSLEAAGAVVIDCIPRVGTMHVVATPAQQAAIEALGMRTKVVVEDLRALEERAAVVAGVGDPFNDFFLGYRTYGSAGEVGTIVWYMNELVAQYPGLASMVEIGTTLQGRTIWGLLVTNQATTGKPGVLYFGAEHSREWITTTAPNFFATHLLENYGTEPLVTDLVDNVEFYLVPVLNVDGYLYTWSTDRWWRKNRRNNGDGTWGVDLNRNWAEGWGGSGSSGNPASETYRGTAPFSEPETQVLRDFFLDHPNIRAQLDIHSFSELILWPWGYTASLPPDQATYEQVGLAMQSLIFDVHGIEYTAGPIYSTIYPVSGGSVDWTYAALDILSFSYELRPSGGGLSAFHLPPEEIIPNNEEILPAMLHLAKTDWVRSGTAGPTVASVRRNRYLSLVSGGSSGIPTAFRVTVTANPLFPETVGDQKWAEAPDENGVSRLGCSPSFWLWDSGTLDIADFDIVPGASYTVETTVDGESFTAPLFVDTVAVWGDVVGAFGDGIWSAPNGSINVQDVLAILDRFSNAPGAPARSRVDLVPEQPDGVINVGDVLAALDAFAGAGYPFAAPSGCP